MVLISGYIFSCLHLPARYKQNNSTGWNSYFNVAFWGSTWATFSFAICILAKYLHVTSTYVMPFFDFTFADIRSDKFFLTVRPDQFIDVLKLAGWCAGTVCFSLVFGLLSRVVFEYTNFRFRLLERISKYSHMDLVIRKAQGRSSPMMITISSQKVYVGLCLGEDLVDGRGDSVAIIPLLSGYRKKETQDVCFTTNYYVQYQNLDLINNPKSVPVGSSGRVLTLDDFRVVINKGDIQYMSYFDIDMYAEWEGVDVSNFAVNPRPIGRGYKA